MENAVEALKIAFGYVMFVAALGISISSFSQATNAVDVITTMRDRETYYTYISPQKDSNGKVITNRIVGVESIVPTLYKAYKENFRVEFRKQNNDPLDIYNSIDANNNTTPVYYIDLEKEVLPNAQEAINHLTEILGKREKATKYNKEFISINGANREDGLYSYLSKHTFQEVLGEYYQEDAGGTMEYDDTFGDINKTKKRVITYILQK